MEEQEDKRKLDGFKQFLLNEERAEATVKSYAVSVNKYFETSDTVTKQGMINFKKRMIETYRPSTAALRCTAMNQYCDYIGKADCKVKTVKTPKRLSVENVPTVEEYNNLIECLARDGPEKWRWLIEYIAKTGARASEIVRFERKHLEQGKAEFWSKGKIRRIFIPAGLIEKSKAYFDSCFEQNPECQWLFPNRYGNDHMTREALLRQIGTYGQKYGLRKEILHPHAFRHLYAVQFLKSNDNIALLADLMGHESVNTTAIYLKLSAQEQKRQLDEAMNW